MPVDSSIRILLVDDDEHYLSSMRRVMRGVFHVTTTNSPTEALRLLENGLQFTVIIADYRMPDMTGIELLSKTKVLAPDMIRIILTGYAELQVAIDAVNHGSISGFLTKPTPAEKLKDFIVTLCERTKHTPVSTAQPVKGIVPITPKELEVMELVRKGCSNSEIAASLHVTVGTVKCHMNNIFYKMNVNSRTKLVAHMIGSSLYKHQEPDK